MRDSDDDVVELVRALVSFPDGDRCGAARSPLPLPFFRRVPRILFFAFSSSGSMVAEEVEEFRFGLLDEGFRLAGLSSPRKSCGFSVSVSSAIGAVAALRADVAERDELVAVSLLSAWSSSMMEKLAKLLCSESSSSTIRR